jgi:FMN-dependent NADH-azoreductase
MVPPDQHTPAQAESWRLSEELVGEIAAADTILLGLPLAAESLAAAERAIDAQWGAAVAA